MEGYKCHCPAEVQGKHCNERKKIPISGYDTAFSFDQKTNQLYKEPVHKTIFPTGLIILLLFFVL